jgi:hypothetical protein
MSMAFDKQPKDSRARTTRDDATSAKELLEQAQALAMQIESLLMRFGQEGQCDAFRVRLARAHTLSLLDQLTDLMGDRPSIMPGPAVRSCAAADTSDEENAASGVRRTALWR